MDWLHKLVGLSVRNLGKGPSPVSQSPSRGSSIGHRTHVAAGAAELATNPGCGPPATDNDSNGLRTFESQSQAKTQAQLQETVFNVGAYQRCASQNAVGLGSGAGAGAGPVPDELGFWPWEAALQGLTEMQYRRWLSLARFLGSSSNAGGAPGACNGASSLPHAASTPSFPASYGADADDSLGLSDGKSRSRLPFTLLPSAGTLEAVRGILGWNPIQGAAALLWPVVTLLIFVGPMTICVGVAILWPFVVRPALWTWFVAEAVFLVMRALEWNRASSSVVLQQVPSREEVSQLLDNIIALSRMGVVEPQEFLSGWFLGAPAACLTKSQVKDFLAFGLYHRDLHELPGDLQAAVEENLDRLEKRWGLQFASHEGEALPTSPQGPGAAAAGLMAQVQTGQGQSRGRGRSLKFMAHTKEPLRALLHPFAFYAWGHTVGILTAVALKMMGFERRTSRSSGLCYYVLRRNLPRVREIRLESEPPNAEHVPLTGGGAVGESPSKEASPAKRRKDVLEHQNASDAYAASGGDGPRVGADGWCAPGAPGCSDDDGDADTCIFVHGLGIGITPYLGFIQQVLSFRRHKTIAVVELPHLAFRLCSTVPTVDELVTGLDEVLVECAGPGGRASFIGHSYGSLVLAQFVRTRPSQVASLGLIDPVCILLCLPYVIYNFVYKYPEFDSLKGTVSDAMRMLFCSRELNVCRALCRGFNWHELHLWAHHLPRQTVVMLAGEDRIVPSERVRRYLESHNVPVLYNTTLGHAQFLFRPDVQKSFLETLYSH